MNDNTPDQNSAIIDDDNTTNRSKTGIGVFFRGTIRFLHKTAVIWNLVIYILLVGGLSLWNPTTITDISLDKKPGQQINLPYTFTDGPGVYTFQAVIHGSQVLRPHLTIKADDCVELLAVDDIPLMKQACSRCANCGPSNVLIPPDLSSGIHRLTLIVQDFGGLGMLDIRQAHAFGWVEALVAITGALAWLWVIRRRRMPMYAWWIVAGAILIVINYHIVTDPWLRQHDVEGHQEYITIIQNQHALPGLTIGWETFQPPLYYLISTTWIKFGGMVSSLDGWRWLQILSGIIYIAAVALATLSWKMFGLSQTATRLGLLLFAFLPANVFLSGRINNDVLLPLWGVLLLLFLEKYIREHRSGFLWVVSACLLGGIMTKFSFLPLLIGTVIILWWTEHKRGGGILQQYILPCLVILPGLLWQLFWGLRSLDQTGVFIYSNAGGLNGALKVENGAFRYLFLDLRAMLTEIQFNAWGGQIRNSLPTSWIVSAVFGEYNFNYLHFPLLSFLSPLFSLVCLLAIMGLLFKHDRDRGEAILAPLILSIAHTLFMIVYNWQYPFAPDGDFRLWAPVFFPMAVIWAYGYQWCLYKLPKIARYIAQAIPIIFLTLLGIFYVYLFLL